MSGDENRNINNINIYTGEDSKVNNDCSGCSYLNHQFDSLKEAALTNFNTLNTQIEKLREANSQQGTKLDELKTDNAELKNDNNKIQSKIDELKTDNAELRKDMNDLLKDFNYGRNCLALRQLLSKYDKDSNKELKFDASLITYFSSVV